MLLDSHLLNSVIAGDGVAQKEFVGRFQPMVNLCARDVSTAGTPWTYADVRQELWLSIFSNGCMMLRKCLNAAALPAFLKVSLSRKAKDIGRQIARERARKQPLPNSTRYGAEQWLTENHLRYTPSVSAPEGRIRDLRRTIISSEMGNLGPSSAGLLKALLFDNRPALEVVDEFGLPNTNALYKKKHYALKRLSSAARCAAESASLRKQQARIDLESVYIQEKDRYSHWAGSQSPAGDFVGCAAV